MSRVRRTFAAVALAARNEGVRRVELAWGASIAAEWAHFVALGVFAYREGGASAVGVAGLVRLLPAAFVAPRVAALGDRVRRERLLLAAMLFGAVGLAGSAAAAFMHSAAAVYGCAALVGISSALVRPTLQALLPSLARTTEELIASNAATSTIESFGTLVGPVLAGVLVNRVPVGVTFAVAAAAVAAGAVLLLGVRPESQAPARADVTRGGTSSALRTIAHHPQAALVTGLMVAQTFVRGCLNVLVVVAAFRLFDSGAGAVGYLTGAIGAGGAIGAIVAMAIHGHRLARTFATSLVFWGLPIAFVGLRPELAPALLLMAVVGVANSFEDVAGFTLLQRAVPDETLSGVLGMFWGVAMGSVAVGSLVAPSLVAAVGARSTFVIVGSLLPVLTVIAYRRLRALDQLGAPTRRQAMIARVPMFAPLSLAAKERLATKLVPVAAAPGDRIIRAGDVGDRFYIVDSGALRIAVDGASKHVGAGEYFGEIALLREVPRTATVTATADSRLYALERADFLTAVSGHAGAKSAADAVIDARLAAPTPDRQ